MKRAGGRKGPELGICSHQTTQLVLRYRAESRLHTRTPLASFPILRRDRRFGQGSYYLGTLVDSPIHLHPCSPHQRGTPPRSMTAARHSFALFVAARFAVVVPQ